MIELFVFNVTEFGNTKYNSEIVEAKKIFLYEKNKYAGSANIYF